MTCIGVQIFKQPNQQKRKLSLVLIKTSPLQNESNGRIPKRPSYSLWLLRGLAWLVLSAGLSTLLITAAYRWVNPPYTWLMVERYIWGDETRLKAIQHDWVNLDSIPNHMVLAVVAAEDNLFMTHWGFDFKSIKEAREEMLQGKRVRGASTISMQVAKNVFLWHGRTWTRKVLEAGFTILVEVIWGKQRIMEVYLNVAEFGPSIYGVEAASQEYFNRKASELTRQQAAMLTTVLPSPLRRNPAKPSQYMRTYQQRVLRNMNNIGEISL
ncbi:monofunctional biosynthetic peptidoglycan transglycosylase [Bacteroidales bacterium M08MB]|nr:monofunctional biosynthetic peptidoglycan transglycosylase [Perlabentimonas gracilis]